MENKGIDLSKVNDCGYNVNLIHENNARVRNQIGKTLHCGLNATEEVEKIYE
nr:MAG TPA: hypothetical protein [Caudoviricetes sp.]